MANIPFVSDRRPDTVLARPAGKTGLTMLVSGVASDSHTWNLVALQLLLEEMGHQVVNLGACVPVESLLAACRANRPDCVVISTVNGHGHVDGAAVISALRADPGLTGLPVVIGGKLSVLGEDNIRIRADLLEHGYDEVFHVGAGGAEAAVEEFRRFVAQRWERVR